MDFCVVSFFAAAALLLASFARADFVLSELSGVYQLSGGSPRCFKSLNISTSNRVLTARSIRLGEYYCDKGVIRITSEPSRSAGNLLTQALTSNAKDVGKLLYGEVTHEIDCSARGKGYIVGKGIGINFVDPRAEFSITWSEIYNYTTELQKNSGEKFNFKAGTKYAIFHTDCLYSRKDYNCFPGSSTVELESGGIIRMDQVKTGDKVKVGSNLYSNIFMWTHHDSRPISRGYVRIETDSGHSLSLTQGHFIYANGKAIAAERVQIGDTLRLGSGAAAKVHSVQPVADTGLYNPQTVHGDIVVNGIVATTYTSAIEYKSGHALLAPLRYFYRLRMGLWQFISFKQFYNDL